MLRGPELAPSPQGLWPLVAQRVAAAWSGQLWGGPQLQPSSRRKDISKSCRQGVWPLMSAPLPHWGAERPLLALGRQFLNAQKPVNWLLPSWELELGRGRSACVTELASPRKSGLCFSLERPVYQHTTAFRRLSVLRLLSGAPCTSQASAPPPPASPVSCSPVCLWLLPQPSTQPGGAAADGFDLALPSL